MDLGHVMLEQCGKLCYILRCCLKIKRSVEKLIIKKMKQSGAATMLLLALTIVLAACGGGTKEAAPSASPTEEVSGGAASPSPESEPATNEETQEKEEGSVSEADKELFKKILSSASSLDSFAATIVADQKMDMAGQAVNTVTSMTMEAVMKPELSFYQTTEVEMGGQKQSFESYMTPEGFYMQDPTTGGWFKFPQELAGEMMKGATSESMDPSHQLEQLADYLDKLKIEEKDDKYVIQLKASGEGFNDLISGNLEAAGMSGADIQIKDMEYYFEIDKANYYPTIVKVYTDMVIGAGDQKTAMIQNLTTTYSKHNEIKGIKVPEEALNASSMDGL
ncbi:hypothetical protein A7K91_17130 [Paenibacillus oryzae]|uniref:Uncharacterized protein n=1 Tax=Paenibacillus oryzae TaxID=1844972 RepID=A0A1A5YD11_9BACL|nr:hypothetical protein A7K91_17130 [Paenibacillus oryzae]